MGVTIKIISGANGAAFQAALDASIAAGERPIGDAWSDATDTYQQVEVYDNKEVFYNPDLFSRNWRARNTLGPGETYPTSSKLSLYEYNVLYNLSAFHSIAGTILSASIGIENVTMSFSPDIDVVYTNVSGIYAQDDVTDGWLGTVTPIIGAAEFSSFTPVSRSYSDVQRDYLGQDYTQTNYTIDGTVDSASVALDNVTMSFSGDSVVATVYTNGSGLYSQVVPGGWVGIITPISGSGTFSPVSRSYTNISQHSASQDFSIA